MCYIICFKFYIYVNFIRVNVIVVNVIKVISVVVVIYLCSRVSKDIVFFFFVEIICYLVSDSVGKVIFIVYCIKKLMFVCIGLGLSKIGIIFWCFWNVI